MYPLTKDKRGDIVLVGCPRADPPLSPDIRFMAINDPWHFPRDAFSLELVRQLDIGLASRLTLVAPRRKGKTEFLLFDLAPAAEKAGYEVVYASLWANVNAPQQSVLKALQMALEERRQRRSAASKLIAAAVNKVRVDALGIGAELEFADRPTNASGDDLAALDRAIDEISAGDASKLLLIFDEIQHLATDKAFAPLIYALRTSLDRRREVRVVFSGSSRGGIRRMFGDQDAPFYGFSTEVELPDLDQAFTDFLAKTFLKVTGRTIDEASLLEQFLRLDRIPFYVRESMKLMALEPELSLADASERLLSAIAEQNDYQGLRSRMSVVDQAVFLEVVRNPEVGGLHGQRFLEELSRIAGKPVSRAYVARRLQRLVDQNLISSVRRGSYQVEMPGFAEWLLQREKTP